MTALKEPFEFVSDVVIFRVPPVACKDIGREASGFPAESTAETEICHGPLGDPP